MLNFKTTLKKLSPSFFVSWYHFLLAFFSALIYCFPSRKIKVIGITGTHGKTTTVELTTKILEEAGYKVAAASSLKFCIAGKEQDNKLKMTMPGRGFLQRFLRKTVKQGCQFAVLEVTSEGVLQHRHRFIKFDVMVFTNLYKEHLERHGGFEGYKTAKGEYFKRCKGTHIVNLNDKNAEYFLKFPAARKIGYGLKIPNSKFLISNQFSISNFQTIITKDYKALPGGIEFIVDGIKFNLKLQGEFNIYNALAAVAVARSQGASLEICQRALDKVKGIAGRMEEVISQPFRVVVDYAFTPDALEQAYQALTSRQQGPTTNNQQPATERKLVCVLGACGGGRDKWKRPELGKIAAKYCKEIVITNEDPYDEEPMEIINQVAQGAGGRARKILDRREAIRKALSLAQPGDTVIITGKGAENSIAVKGGKKLPWDDRRVVKEEFNNI